MRPSLQMCYNLTVLSGIGWIAAKCTALILGFDVKWWYYSNNRQYFYGFNDKCKQYKAYALRKKQAALCLQKIIIISKQVLAIQMQICRWKTTHKENLNSVYRKRLT